jgi:hypothetical protein
MSSGQGPAEQLPLVAGPVYGIRSWRLAWRDDRPIMSGAFQDARWSPGTEPTRAYCAVAHHQAPAPDCGCGIYGIHPNRFSDWAHLSNGRSGERNNLVGIIEAWGRVELHDDGFRAEYARPYALVEIKSLGLCDPKQVAAALGIPNLHFRDPGELARYCCAHGLGLDPAVIAELVPAAEEFDIETGFTPPVGLPPPATPRPISPRALVERIGEWVAMAVLLVLGALFYGGIAIIAVSISTSILFGWPYSDEKRPIGIGKVLVDKKHCSLRASVRTTERLEVLVIRLTGRDSEGDVIANGTRKIRSLPKGRSTQKLGEVAPGVCRRLETVQARLISSQQGESPAAAQQ